MRVGVKEPVPEDHRHPRLGDEVREVAPLFERETERVDVGELRPVEPLECQHARARVRPVDLRHLHVRVAGEVAVERLRVAALEPVVELLPDLPRELVDEPTRVDEVERADTLLHELRRLVQEDEVGLDLTRCVRTLHLHRHGAAVRKRRAVHLSDRRCRNRHRVEIEEEAFDRVPQLLLDHALRLFERERTHVVLERPQLDDQVVRDDVGPHGQKLSELHERRPELLQHLPQVLAARRRRHRIDVPRPPSRNEVGQPVRLEEVAEAVAHHDLRDLGQAAERPRCRLGHATHCDTTWRSRCARRPHGPGGTRSCSTCRYARPTRGRSLSRSTHR